MGINSALYLTLFNPQNSEPAQMDVFLNLLETALFKIVIVDERIGRKCFEKIAGVERFKSLRQ